MGDAEGSLEICLRIKGKGAPRQRDQLPPEQHSSVIDALSGIIAPVPTGQEQRHFKAKCKPFLLLRNLWGGRAHSACPVQ